MADHRVEVEAVAVLVHLQVAGAVRALAASPGDGAVALLGAGLLFSFLLLCPHISKTKIFKLRL